MARVEVKPDLTAIWLGRFERWLEVLMMRSLVIRGYASLFGLEDMAGDEVRAGAPSRSLAGGRPVEMLG